MRRIGLSERLRLMSRIQIALCALAALATVAAFACAALWAHQAACFIAVVLVSVAVVALSF